MARSRSSPSPPPVGGEFVRKLSVKSRPFRRRRGSFTPDRLNTASPTLEAKKPPSTRAETMDWSTSYQAGSSGSPSCSSTEDDDALDEPLPCRGRAGSQRPRMNGESKKMRLSPSSIQRNSSEDSVTRHRRRPFNGRGSFTRSRSPAVINANSANMPLSPSVLSHFRQSSTRQTMLPAALQTRICLPLTRTPLTLYIDARKAAECILLLGSLLYANSQLMREAQTTTQPDVWISIELIFLIIVSSIYILWTHASMSSSPLLPPITNTFPPKTFRPSSPRLHEGRESKRSNNSTPLSMIKKDEFGFIWMSVPKNYRESTDDGLVTGILLGPLLTVALLYSSLQQAKPPSNNSPLPAAWIIEPPTSVGNPTSPAPDALVFARLNLVNLATFCSTILLFHVCASRWFEARSRSHRGSTASVGERGSVPRSEEKKSLYYVVFTFGLSLSALCLRFFLARSGIRIWQHMNYFEMSVSSLFYQLTLYVAIRLAHRGFTLGELGLVCFGGTALCMELLSITIARIWPVTTPFIKTYRLPTPLLIFQLALVAGSLLTGFLLSPLLVLSRHVAQRPVHRLRFPQEKQRQRRLLAVGFYGGAVIIIGGLIGMWTRWCLGNRDPWLWVIFWLLEGRTKWSRPALLGYWALLCSISVAGWNRQLARSRKYRSRNTATNAGDSVVPENSTTISPSLHTPAVQAGDSSAPVPPSPGAMSLTFSNLPNGGNVSNVATDLLDAADKHVPTLGLNARRKFFHALAVVMFLPGVAFDPAFTHLSFSAAFALFTFAEYVRYFAIYPFGAAVHLFMNEFLDHKDSGTAILSHFYLLTGCAGSLWLEGPTQLLQFTGILALGVGDALASIIGKRIGTHRWSPTTSKTIEGSAAFTVSIILFAWALRLCSLAESFSTWRYTVVIGLSSVLEALSAQNDNLTLPLYMWSMLVIVDL